MSIKVLKEATRYDMGYLKTYIGRRRDNFLQGAWVQGGYEKQIFNTKVTPLKKEKDNE